MYFAAWVRAAAAVILLVYCGAAQSSVQWSLTPEAMEVWADQAFAPAAREHRFSGLAVTVVHGNRVLLNKGYGVEDVASGRLVDPVRTRLRIASVTKTFTAVAIAQLLEQGRIRNLDDPANAYLKRLQLPRWQDRDITVRHLLTHSAGFEDSLVGIGRRADSELETIDTRPPAGYSVKLVRPPGEWSVYSNYGVGILGMLVEDITGIGLADCLRRTIFEPLGMNDTELSYGPPSDAGLGRPYSFRTNGTAEPVPDLAILPFFGAGGGIVSTAADMAKFMAAQLDAERGARSGLLSRHMLNVLHAVHARNHPDVAGIGMLFVVSEWSGERVLSHSGGWPGWYSTMILLPDRGVGYFATALSEAAVSGPAAAMLAAIGAPVEGDSAGPRPFGIADLSIAFTSAFLGSRSTAAGTIQSLPTVRWNGSYLRERRAHTSSEKMFELVNPASNVLRVSSDEKGEIWINGRGPYISVGNDTYGLPSSANTRAGAQLKLVDVVAFQRDSRDRAVLVLAAGNAVSTRVPSFEDPILVAKALRYALVVCLSGLLALGWSASTRGERLGRFVVIALAIGSIATVATLYAGFGAGENWRIYKLVGEPARFVGLTLIANLTAIACVVVLCLLPMAWRQSGWGANPRGLLRRLHFTVIASGSVAALWAIVFTNLLGWRLPL